MADDSEFAEYREYYSENKLATAAVAGAGYNKDAAWTAPGDAPAMAAFKRDLAADQITRERYNRAHYISDQDQTGRVVLFKLSEVNIKNFPIFCLKRKLTIRLTLKADRGQYSRITKAGDNSVALNNYKVSDVLYQTHHLVPDQAHLVFQKQQLLNGGLRYKYTEVEGRFIQNLVQSGQHDISSANSILLRTIIMFAPSDQCANTVLIQPQCPGLGTNIPTVKSNRGLTHTVPDIVHTRININGIGFPGANSLDDMKAEEVYQYQKHIDDCNIPLHRFGDKGFLTIDYTGHKDMFRLPELLTGQGIQNGGKFISWIFRGQTTYTSEYADAFVYNESSVLLKFEGKGMTMTKYFNKEFFCYFNYLFFLSY